MSDAQERTASNLDETERTKLKDDLAEMRHTILESRTSRAALIVGVLAFLLAGKLGLTLAMGLGVVAGAIAYAVKKASLQKMLLSSIAGYDDEKLRYWHQQALVELLAAQKRSSLVRGTLAFIAVILIVIWIVARVQR